MYPENYSVKLVVNIKILNICMIKNLKGFQISSNIIANWIPKFYS